MSTEEKSLHFIEQIIEDSLSNGFPQDKLRFRFPPEPNGYLHIGHAKSICLNFGLGLKYNAPVNLRFDDTNPAKEEQEYVDAIKEDVKWLGFNWTEELYSSDYFQQLYEWAVIMIKNGKAYVDSQSSEDMSLQKGTPTQPGVDGPYRNRSIEENLSLFEGMKNGDFPEGSHVLRAKIDMTSTNMLMRDPLMYRILHRHHHRTGNQWNIYPMYDYAHGESDYIEQISHSICTLEFVMHRELYNWFLDQIYDESNVRPHQYEFARLNLNYTVMSKRKLLQLVQENIVNGWDDPRMPTISGLRRRGYTAASIRKFCDIIGVAKRENIIDFSLLEFCLREDLNKTAPRVMAVLDPIKLVITNYPEDKEEWLEAENNQEDESAGFRKVPFSKELYIERDDFLEEAPAKFFRLSLGREVRLKNAYIIKGERVVKDAAGTITEIHVTYDEDSRSGSGSEASQRKVAGTLHWVAIKHALEAEVRLYDRLFIDEAPDSHKEKNFLEFMNPNSLEIVKGFVEPSLATVQAGEKFQFQRLGYFNVDNDTSIGKIVFNKTVGLKDAWEEKGKKEENLLMNTQKEINKYVKEKDENNANLILNNIVDNIKSIDNYSLIIQSLVKNIKNDNNSLLFSNLILQHSDKVQVKDIEEEALTKLYTMSLKSQMAAVRILAVENLQIDLENFNLFQTQLSEMKKNEKNEKVLQLLNELKF
ncbi:MAG TPA: glutamine--tRNA ligase/YqeY domain fusion protein [Flavobacterium sp.]|mgnify:FL=1|jgi:glutaminyl-tRNA synthetase|uniref:glutamine--tRNA ligase/YqeY domain fusion protein n=1 Tax=Flavobacterium sp. TaxID=239 RepID=UPI001B53E603|nr:glutamine--tRNA ligase/YqeY domain fusion protein [Flavobacterium sp.]MBP7182935.1 glutamine--tRNA ligase/YqeY domain fusion protein [Flavobacterium sp.]MBP8886370.1 glutamine--tRNA ligase/YqeY domain fusion protein [Flavobacterium sp.]HRL70849.1 glutamine--tRNA ligase/YqeY domain fusion protein [Flavobacterium sp.]HRM46389.1 glutamine--tRNA ligase/YqeY domain fusion protein [Flavobacterium sp.]HRN44484.1 glutamine--tRNA ligase/YqeY domain fusion protein [Flavobacterium sp.]